jgi:hypothetical protein
MMIEVASHEASHEPTTAGVTRVDELDLAVERLGRMAATRPICEGERRLLEAARDCLASYASAAHDLADAGVATPRLIALIERGWREALTAFNRAEEERAARQLTATG